MTNDLIVAMMSTDKGRQAMAKYVAENTDEETATTFGDKVKNLFCSVAEAVERVKNINYNFQDVMRAKGASEFEKFADQFVEALDKAIANYKATEDGTVADKNSKRVMSYEVDGELIKGAPTPKEYHSFFNKIHYALEGNYGKYVTVLDNTPPILQKIGL